MSTVNEFSGGAGLQVIVFHKATGEYFIPAVLDGVTWELCRKGAPGLWGRDRRHMERYAVFPRLCIFQKAE